VLVALRRLETTLAAAAVLHLLGRAVLALLAWRHPALRRVTAALAVLGQKALQLPQEQHRRVQTEPQAVQARPEAEQLRAVLDL
jgi:hypothetical protein